VNHRSAECQRKRETGGGVYALIGKCRECFYGVPKRDILEVV